MEALIQDNVAIPEKKESWKSKLEKMEVGQSFAFPRTLRRNLQSLISTDFHSVCTKRFTISVVGQLAGEARVWRIKDAAEE